MMKNFYAILLLLATTYLFSQTTIYSENFGNPSDITLINNYTGFQNSSPISYSGTADLRTSTPSSGYTNASGMGCVFIGGSTAPYKYILIEGINTENYNNITLTLGHQKGTNASSNELTIEVSDNGTAWTPLSYTRPTGPNTSNWILITPTGNIPSTPNLRIRFTNESGGTVGFRIDDVKLEGTLINLSTQDLQKKDFKIYPTSITEGIIYIHSNNKNQKKVKIFNLEGRLVLESYSNKEINVSTLQKGNYIVTVEDSGNKISEKVSIK